MGENSDLSLIFECDDTATRVFYFIQDFMLNPKCKMCPVSAPT